MSSIAITEFKARRERVLAQMEAGAVALFPAASEVTRSRDTEFPFRQDSDFHYLTGFPEPDAILVLIKADNNTPNSQNQSMLFCLPKDPVAEIWQGRRFGQEQAAQNFLFDQAYSLDEAERQLIDILNGVQHIYFSQGSYAAFDTFIFDLLSKLRSNPKKGWKAPQQITDVRHIVHEMRLFKSDAEIAVMRQAGAISCEAHKRAMQFVQPGATEFQIEAELHHHYAMNGARYPAYGTIAGSGDNACILHYTENNAELHDGDLLLVDSGCELAGYAADITRTYPVNGQFSKEQAALYQIVLDAQLAALEYTKPGGTLKQAADVVNRIITQGLVSLGILQGDVEALIEQAQHKRFYMHGLGHWLGLDVHDVGEYKINDVERPFEPGMVLTIEPGIYISQSEAVDDKWKGIGIRIEDNILITEHGYDNLTQAVPKTIAEIEALMKKVD
ncbi:Xaa-Pro aminopeptidase [Flocculibacter collagenilyticus]|uniref:Xaa-Pro aminopeptidase n=1 Tax=Flocculibacter collagenilyticus TaxID=2744479 RepID=UPI001F16E3A1|nr:Xaa-Pro aminopeptidase [Flocculibacter collagenilyticus]